RELLCRLPSDRAPIEGGTLDHLIPSQSVRCFFDESGRRSPLRSGFYHAESSLCCGWKARPEGLRRGDGVFAAANGGFEQKRAHVMDVLVMLCAYEYCLQRTAVVDV